MSALTNDDTVCVVETKKICLEPDDPEYRRLLQIAKDKYGYVESGGPNSSSGPLVQFMIQKTGSRNELEMWKKTDEGAAKAMIFGGKYKPFGPTDTTTLLNNFNIDETLHGWETNSEELFKKRFKHIPFQMIDFAQHHTELERLDIAKLSSDGYDSFGVVLNTDTSDGRGKHWFCIYGEKISERNGDQRTNPPSTFAVEFFNSSGNPPRPEIIGWFARKNEEYHAKAGRSLRFVRASPMRLQYSDTECGVWSLLYIKSRLMGKPVTYFYDKNTTDDEVTEQRRGLFVKK